MYDSITYWILRYYPIRRVTSEKELFAEVVKRRMIDDLLFLKAMVPASEMGIAMLTDGKVEEEAKWHSLSEIDHMRENIRDIHVMSLILKNYPSLSFFDDETVENIRRETRRLLGETMPALLSEISTAKKDAKAYQGISKQFKEMLQGIQNLDLFLVRYTGEVGDGGR